MTKEDFVRLADWAENCLKARAYIESEAAFKLILRISTAASERGQRKSITAPPANESRHNAAQTQNGSEK
jgi:hypothetical protein